METYKKPPLRRFFYTCLPLRGLFHADAAG